MRYLAWILGLTGALLCAATIVATLAVGFTDQPVSLFLGYTFGILMGLLGALIASRHPRNGVGWLMCLTSIATCLVNLPTDYAYAALIIKKGAWPLGSEALWFSSWSSIPILSLWLPLILARFPDGKIRPRWRFVDWLAIAGTVSWVLSVALAPADIGLVTPKVAAQLFPHAHTALWFSVPNSILDYAWMGGLFTVVATYVAAAAAVAARFRQAHGDERIQLKWFAYACALLALTCVYAAVAWWFGAMLGDALVPFTFVVISLPLAIGIAILRYRLFDIDLIINRTLVYLGLTAILGAMYTALVTFLNRYFISVSGQKSDAAYVLTAFAVVAAFGPVKDALQRRVDRRLGGVKASAALDRFSEDVDAVVSVLDVHRVACRLVDQAVVAFDAHWAALYIESVDAVYSRGTVNGDASIEVPIRHDGRQLGRLVLAERRGHVTFSHRDREALQRSADTVGEALALANRLGHGRFEHGTPASVRH